MKVSVELTQSVRDIYQNDSISCLQFGQELNIANQRKQNSLIPLIILYF